VPVVGVRVLSVLFQAHQLHMCVVFGFLGVSYPAGTDTHPTGSGTTLAKVAAHSGSTAAPTAFAISVTTSNDLRIMDSVKTVSSLAQRFGLSLVQSCTSCKYPSVSFNCSQHAKKSACFGE
jgi:hypothetical protein